MKSINNSTMSAAASASYLSVWTTPTAPHFGMFDAIGVSAAGLGSIVTVDQRPRNARADRVVGTAKGRPPRGELR